VASFSIYATDAPPTQGYGTSPAEDLTVGTEFWVTGEAWLTHLRYPHVVVGGTATRKTMALYDTTGAMVLGPFLMPPGVPGEWNVLQLDEAFKLVPGTRYRVAAFYPDGGYPAAAAYFSAENFGMAQQFGPLTVPGSVDVASGAQGSFTYNPQISYPATSFNSGGYYSDVVVTDVNPNPLVSNIFGADGEAYEAFTLVAGILTPVTPNP
jgi:hypothetical protein